MGKNSNICLAEVSGGILFLSPSWLLGHGMEGEPGVIPAWQIIVALGIKASFKTSWLPQGSPRQVGAVRQPIYSRLYC